MFTSRMKRFIVGVLYSSSSLAARSTNGIVAHSSMKKEKIIYTLTDEAPLLASYSLLPIVTTMCAKAGIPVESVDIGLASRIIAAWPKYLSYDQRMDDGLAFLGTLCQTPFANIIKLPNISASVPQLQEAILELRLKGYDVPIYVTNPKTEKEHMIHDRYAKILGSAVNPVLREGNSDRRVALPVKNYAKKNPHVLSTWSRASRSHVACMKKGDFYDSEQSHTITLSTSPPLLPSAVAAESTATAAAPTPTVTAAASKTYVMIEHTGLDGKKTILKDKIVVQQGEIMDASFMSVRALRSFLEEEMEDAKKEDMLLSLHLKATMMKISDPYIFGQAVRVFFQELFEKYEINVFREIDFNPNNGLQDLYDKMKFTDTTITTQLLQDIDDVYEKRPWLAMVDSEKGITNLHCPSDVIVDASMPCVIRDSGRMWNKDNELEDVKCIIPDRCYATMYQEIMSFCKQYGQFDVATMGSVSNVGLMAQKAEEYGSHDKTFVVSAGTMKVIQYEGREEEEGREGQEEEGKEKAKGKEKEGHGGEKGKGQGKEGGKLLMEHQVEDGDIWRMCQTKDISIRDWVRLAVSRAKASGDGTITVFWLDPHRAHDREIMNKINTFLPLYDTAGLDIRIMSPVHAMRLTCERAREGKDTISVTGNVLRDYLTDLFPILELGTSAKMLSIVPLLAGGGLFETGAGGSAPKHIEQFVKEGHLRWDSLGEYLAIASSLEHYYHVTHNQRAHTLSKTLNLAIERLLQNRKSPGRKVNQLDNRASNFYLALYWSEIMAKEDPIYLPLATALRENRQQVVAELKQCQGKPVDLGGYYKIDPNKAAMAMRPSITFNEILDSFGYWTILQQPEKCIDDEGLG